MSGKPVGLQNLWQTCFVNAVVQCLNATSLSRSLKAATVNQNSVYGGDLTAGLSTLFQRMVNAQATSVPTGDFISLVNKHWTTYNIGEQMDSQEFMTFLLTALHEDLKTSEGCTRASDLVCSNRSVITDLFGHIEVNETRCLGLINQPCSYVSMVSDEPACHVTLYVPSKKFSSLKECFDMQWTNTSPESYLCPDCGLMNSVNVSKKFGRLPPILIIHLSRFLRQESGEICRNSCFVKYGVVLDVRTYLVEGLEVQANTKYRLFGVVCHEGTLDRGHYTAFTSRNGRWYKCDDSVVTNATAQAAVSENAYLLWFQLEDGLYADESKVDKCIPVPRGQIPVHRTKIPVKREHLQSRVPFKQRPHNDGGTRKVQHPAHLDVTDPLLTEDDVEGAKIDITAVDNYRVPQLQRWLQVRGLPVSGKRQELIERIRDHAARGKSAKIDPAVDGGRWHKIKQRSVESVSTGDAVPAISSASREWNAFPSVKIPEGFSYDSIHKYFNDICPVAFSYRSGVVTTPTAACHEESSDSTTDEENSLARSQDLTFHDLVKQAVATSIKKGQQFLSSGRVLGVLDASKDNHYFIKAQVQASMEMKLYTVYIIIDASSGELVSCSCCCKAQALGRCGHIASVLLLMWKHVCVEGFEAITTTGRQCYWRRAAPPKDPGFVKEKAYPAKKDPYRRVNFDPSPTDFKTDGPIGNDELSKFKKMLLLKSPGCCWVYHIVDAVGITEEDEDDINDTLMGVDELCSKFLWEMNRIRDTHSAPFELDSTRNQSNSGMWFVERSKRCTASTARTILGLSSDKSRRNFLRKHVWQLDKFQSDAMAYGSLKESDARKAYNDDLKKVIPDVEISETGLWVNPKYPQLACSPDGLIHTAHMPVIPIEIKVLSNISINPERFDEDMTEKQLKSFYLARDKEGHILLKPNHRYHYQIQMTLDILELDFCHLVVWSESGYAVVPVKRDPAFWTEKRQRLIKFHREFIVPEHFLQRTKRHLPPLQVTYANFHESEHDMYFHNR